MTHPPPLLRKRVAPFAGTALPGFPPLHDTRARTLDPWIPPRPTRRGRFDGLPLAVALLALSWVVVLVVGFALGWVIAEGGAALGTLARTLWP
jgi:hypothetical protein